MAEEKTFYQKIMEATRLMVDPPSGWMYGFPMVWDKELEPDLKTFLRAKGYPEKDLDFAMNHIRMWLPKEEKNYGADA